MRTPWRSSAPDLKGHRGVERGLAAEGGQQRVGLLADDDFLDDFRRDRLDVGAVGELRVGHDGGRVGVDQDDLVAFLLEGLAGLDAGVVEFAALADDDGAGADDEDFADRGVFGHGARSILVSNSSTARFGQVSSRGITSAMWRRVRHSLAGLNQTTTFLPRSKRLRVPLPRSLQSMKL
jgi:hypothetical protein